MRGETRSDGDERVRCRLYDDGLAPQPRDVNMNLLYTVLDDGATMMAWWLWPSFLLSVRGIYDDDEDNLILYRKFDVYRSLDIDERIDR